MLSSSKLSRRHELGTIVALISVILIIYFATLVILLIIAVV